jgi:hypothetical protein
MKPIDVETLCSLTGESYDDLRISCKKGHFPITRGWIYEGLHQRGFNLTQIARLFNMETHSTVIHGMRMVRDARKDPYDKFHYIIRKYDKALRKHFGEVTDNSDLESNYFIYNSLLECTT